MRNSVRLVFWIALISFAFSNVVSAQTAVSLGDLNKVHGPKSFLLYAQSGSKFYFDRNTDEFGYEPWVSDGTAAGTHILKDIVPGAAPSLPISFIPVVINGQDGAYFLATTPNEGTELWVTDGTEAGTYMVKDINPGSSSGLSNGLVSLSNMAVLPNSSILYFSADDGINGEELWITDGMPDNASILSDINPGSGSSDPQNLIIVNGALLFTANDSVSGRELYGTLGIFTAQIADINPGAGSSDPKNILTLSPSEIVMTATDGVAGREPFISDTVTTSLIKDYTPGNDDTMIYSAFNLDPTTPVFSALNLTMPPVATNSLIRTDGSAAGTASYAELPCFLGGPFVAFVPFAITSVVQVVNGKAVFPCYDLVTQEVEPWVTDGTGPGTFILKDIFPGGGSSEVLAFNRVSNGLVFSANDSVHGLEPWITDGTSDGTKMIADFNPGELGSIDPELLFFSLLAPPGTTNTKMMQILTIGTRSTMAVTDGTEANTVEIFDDSTADSDGSEPSGFQLAGKSVIFSAYHSKRGVEPYYTNGKKKGTKLLKNLNRGGSSFPDHFVKLSKKKTLFFAATNQQGRELWVTDGTKKKTKLVKDINPGYPSGVAANPNILLNKKLYFVGNDGVSGAELWVTNGKKNGTKLVKDINAGPLGSDISDFAALGDKIIFKAYDETNGEEPWISDGTEAGTMLLANIGLNDTGSAPALFTTVGSKVFFAAADSVAFYELWVTDGTTAGTMLVKDIDPVSSSAPYNLTATENFVFFVASDGVNGQELWRSDGTAAGTVMIADIYAGANSPGISEIVPISGDRVVFNATDGVSGDELWIAGATPGSAVMLKDVFAGSTGSEPSHLFRVPGVDRVLFSANTSTEGTELWSTDGTPEGTVLVADIIPGTESSFPSNFFVKGKKLYFSAVLAGAGQEPYVMKLL